MCDGLAPPVAGSTYTVQARSLVVLVALDGDGALAHRLSGRPSGGDGSR